jgi:hypothetical protein
MPMHPTEKFIGDLWFIEACASDQQAAVPAQIVLSTPLNREETEASLVCFHVLLCEASLGFGDGEGCAALVLT